MKIEGWLTFEEYDEPILWWIKYRKGEPIPEDMKFKGW